MLTLHLCIKKEDENKTRLKVADIIEAKIRKKLDYRDSIFTTFAVTMARENVNLSINSRSEFNKLMDKLLDSEDDNDYFCIDARVYMFIWTQINSNSRCFKNLSVVIDDKTYNNPSLSVLSDIIYKRE